MNTHVQTQDTSPLNSTEVEYIEELFCAICYGPIDIFSTSRTKWNKSSHHGYAPRYTSDDDLLFDHGIDIDTVGGVVYTTTVCSQCRGYK